MIFEKIEGVLVVFTLTSEDVGVIYPLCYGGILTWAQT